MTDEELRWQPDNIVAREIRHAALQLDMSFQDTASFLVGIGIALAQQRGLLDERATEPMGEKELFRRLAAHLLGVDPHHLPGTP